MGNRNGFGGCAPIAQPGNATSPIRSRVYDMKAVTAEDYRPVGLAIYASLSATAVTGQATYRVPATHKLAITEIRGHLALMDVLNEKRFWDNPADATLGVGTNAIPPDLFGRIALKAMNVHVNLKNQDREQKVFDNSALTMASILEIVGGSPLNYENNPLIVAAGETLQLDVSLVQAATSPPSIGGIEAGVLLGGVLIRTSAS